MRQLIYSILLIPFLYSCGESETVEEEEVGDETIIVEETIEEEETVNSFILSTQQVGIFAIGHQVPQLPAELKSRQGNLTLNQEGLETTYEVTMVFNDLEDVVDLRLEDNDALHYEDKHIIEMIVHSNYYETEEGIGVGSTMDEFILTYPDYEIWYSYVSDLYVIEAPELAQIQFVLNPHDYLKVPKGNKDREVLDSDDFSESTKIESIRVF